MKCENQEGNSLDFILRLPRDKEAKIYMNDEAVTEYLLNQSQVLTIYNNNLLVNTDNASINTTW